MYYGTGGTKDEMATFLAAPKYRPDGYDCEKGKFRIS